MPERKRSFPIFFKDAVVIGAALFSMFFGAGNMIFPPFLGFSAGSKWLVAFVCYFLTDIGLAMIAMAALIRKNGPDGIVKPLGKVAGNALLAVVALCMSLIIAIPRTAATTYELSIAPLTDALRLPVFSLLFFVVVLLLSFSESAVVDIVGKILAPVLFIGLLIAIVCGVVSPVGEIQPAVDAAVIPEAISAGYQTMDVFGAVFLGMLVLQSVTNRGYSAAARVKLSAVASLIASVGLFVVYMGLTYLGATASSLFSGDVSRTVLLNGLIARLLPGRGGSIFFGVVVGLACLTTAIALASSSAEFFSNLSGGKLSYRVAVGIICAVSAALACIGVEQLVSFAGAILSVVYPPVLILIILTFLDRWIGKTVYRFGCGVAFLMGIFETLGICPGLIAALPLAAEGFAWLIPSLVAIVVGQLLSCCQKKN